MKITCKKRHWSDKKTIHFSEIFCESLRWWVVKKEKKGKCKFFEKKVNKK